MSLDTAAPDGPEPSLTGFCPRVNALTSQLEEALPEDLQPLVCDLLAEGEDRALRIVRQLCLEYEAPDLWQRIACLVLGADTLRPQDDARYVSPRRGAA